jgi:hypothetical protein
LEFQNDKEDLDRENMNKGITSKSFLNMWGVGIKQFTDSRISATPKWAKHKESRLKHIIIRML